MFRRKQLLSLPEDRGPLRVAFVTTSMTTGGEEILLVSLIRRLDKSRFAPELICLKELGELGETLEGELPISSGLLTHKRDLRVLGRLSRYFRQRKIDCVVTVGTGGDRMFWGRLAAYRSGVPVILSAIHSTGWPTYIEWPNRLLQPLTDGFIAVAESHGEYLVKKAGCPARKVHVIPNGIDVHRFCRRPPPSALIEELGLKPGMPVAGIVAEVRPEKNHEMFLRVADRARREFPQAKFLIIGDGEDREAIERLTDQLDLRGTVHFCGRRSDIPELLNVLDVLLLTSHMEASPVSILEALASETPVISTSVGSIPDVVHDGQSGYLVPPGDVEQFTDRVMRIFSDPLQAQAMGRRGRAHVAAHGSLEQMVRGYEDLIEKIYCSKCQRHSSPTGPPESSIDSDAVKEQR